MSDETTETTLRDMIAEISPPFLRDDVGGVIQRAFGAVLDAASDREAIGVKLRFPQVTTPTALGYIGVDRNIERGPSQADDGYAAQLVAAFDTWRNAGGARTILGQLRLRYAPDNGPYMKMVAECKTEGGLDLNVWHEINPSTGAVIRTETSPHNWEWGLMNDGHRRWWYGWVIMDMSGSYALDKWGDPGNWGDGGVWGFNKLDGSPGGAEEVQQLNAILSKWKPANMQEQIIFTFGTPLTMPTGSGYVYEWQASQAAAFLQIQGT